MSDKPSVQAAPSAIPNPLDVGPPAPQDNRGVETQAVRPTSGVHQVEPLVSEYQPGDKKLPDGTIRSDF